MNMYNHLSDDILKIIFDYVEPSLNMLIVNRKSNKKNLPLLRYTFANKTSILYTLLLFSI